MSAAATLPQMLWRNAARWPTRPAWRHKRLGIWQTTTWSGFAASTEDIAGGLAAAGFGPGDRLAVLGDSRPELYAALLAAQSLGGVGVPIDPETDGDRLTAILRTAAVSVLVTDTTEAADRLRPLAAALPQRLSVIGADPGGLRDAGTAAPESLAALAATGRATAATRPDLRAEFIAREAPELPALLLYPAASEPDTRTLPHPAAPTHAELLAAAAAIAAADPVRPTDNTLCFLPISSYENAVHALALGLLGGFTCNCPEAPDQVPRDLREIGPTILYLPPPACAALARIVTTRRQAASPLKRYVFGYFERLALAAEILREQALGVPPRLVLGCWVGEWVAYAPARDQLGLGRARWVHSGGPVPAEAGRLLRALGVALRPGVRLDRAALAPRGGEMQHA